MAGAIQDLTSATFREEVGTAEVPVLVDFWAEWYGPCRAMTPVLEGIAADHRDRLKVFKLNIEEYPQVAVDYDVMSFPTMLVFRDGVPAKRMVGARSRGHLLEELTEFLN